MARSYWERWNWELQKRKEEVALNRSTRSRPKQCSSQKVYEIEPSMLKDPKEESAQELWIGRGSFGVLKLQLYRGIKVVSKELLPKTLLEDVHHEASILTKRCHPYLPYLFGVCTKQRPFRLIMQFHGIGSSSCTLAKMLCQEDRLIDGKVWLHLCAQMFEAIRFLHDEASVLHNDIKSNNMLVAQSVSTEPEPELGPDNVRVQIVVIDFGMASSIADNKRLRKREN